MSNLDAIFHRSPGRTHPEAVRGEGVYLYDAAGNRYLDACAGALVANIGHGVREVASAVGEQAAELAFVHGSRWTSPVQQELGRRIAAMAPPGLSRTFFVNSGSEAAEASVKMALQFFIQRDGPDTPKHKVLGRWLSFHGVTVGALSIGGNIARRKTFARLLREQPKGPPCYCYRCPFGLTYPACQVHCATALEEIIRQEGPETIAAFIAEPVVGATLGAVAAVPEYFRIVRDLCDKYDILFISDEVMTGFGRTGKNFGIDHYGVVPDMMVVAKGMTAGYAPMAAVVAHERVWETFLKGPSTSVQGHTYGGNPLSAAAGVAVLEYIENHRLVERAARLEPVLLGALRALRRHRMVGDVRGKGLMAGIELVRDPLTKEPWDAALGVAERVTRAAVRRGVVPYPSGGNVEGRAGDLLLIGPPLTITEEQIAIIAAGLDGAIAEVAAELEASR